MWQRFTERTRRVIFFAQEEAARLGENYVGTEHLLLGLVRENDSVAARLLERLGLDLDAIRAEAERRAPRGDGRLGQEMQLTPRGKRVIDFAYEEARRLNNNYIGTEHLLLGLVREDEGPGGKVLTGMGLTLDRLRQEVATLQGERPDESSSAGYASGDAGIRTVRHDEGEWEAMLNLQTDSGSISLPLSDIQSIRVETAAGELAGRIVSVTLKARSNPGA